MTARKPPLFFEKIYNEAKALWDELEAKPQISRPWWQLFRQIQSPRHVVSELLQNADDAGAESVFVQLDGDQFVFEHDGRDFTEDELRSLCNFGLSSKSNLFTIGFRGVGFKSIFSLGDEVVLLTPTLAVRFCERRFTQPEWIESAGESARTRIVVRLTKGQARTELEKNLQEWSDNPVSLIFFRRIRRLSVNGRGSRLERLGAGPVPNSERLRLEAGIARELLLISSESLPFPAEAQEEIRQERFEATFEVPPCTVQLVLGLPDPQQAFVVLPSGVKLDLPFSCNAPFVQDPARSKIKSPSLSATNRWLLERVGHLAGEAMLNWLGNRSLSSKERARAYDLLPQKPEVRDSLESDVAQAICQGMESALADAPLLLASDGELVGSDHCLVPPAVAYEVWSPPEILTVFQERNPPGHVLASEVTLKQRRALRSWGMISSVEDEELLRQLEVGQKIPRPADYQRLQRLWYWVRLQVERSFDWGRKRSVLQLVPVTDSPVLWRAQDVVRLPERATHISEGAWQFLCDLVQVVDPAWIEHLDTRVQREPQRDDVAGPRRLLTDLGLGAATSLEKIAQHACTRLFARGSVSLEEHVRIAHLLAALDVEAPKVLRAVTRDGVSRPWEELIGSDAPWVEELLPEEWQAARVLHDEYFQRSDACPTDKWRAWLESQRARILLCPPLVPTGLLYRSKLEVCTELERRRGTTDFHAPYVTPHFEWRDFDFPAELIERWSRVPPANLPAVWASVVKTVRTAPRWYWRERLCATVTQVARKHTYAIATGPIPAAWVFRLRSLPCLPDTEGHIRPPSELYLRNRETESLLGVEPFVEADFDNEATKPLLELLGVRTRPAGIEKPLDRLRALAQAPDARRVVSEVKKQCRILDQALRRADPRTVEIACQAFDEGRLILTENYEWVRRSEVYLRTSEVYPDAPLIHPVIADLKLWRTVGVAEEPSPQAVLQWLSRLTSGQRLESRELDAVRRALGRFPREIWQATGHWLSADNTWVPVDRLRYRITMQTLVRYQELFASVKERTANLTMLQTSVYVAEPFAVLRDLNAVLEERPSEIPKHWQILRGNLKRQQPAWLRELGRQLGRVIMPEEALQQRCRELAARMAGSVIYRLSPHEPLSVVPCIDGEPAGPAVRRDVLWYDQTLFVRDGKAAKYAKAMVAELAKPFDDTGVKEAITTCFDRSPEFIADYFEANFQLEARAELSPLPVIQSEGQGNVGGDGATGATVMGSTPDAEDGEDADWRENETPLRAMAWRRRSPGISEDERLFRAFARMLGYCWDESKRVFFHEDGSFIIAAEKPFHWCRCNAAGEPEYRYWVSPKVWGEEDLVIPAELWEILKDDPNGCGLVVRIAPNRPGEMSATTLKSAIEQERIRIYPEAFRLRLVERAERSE